MIYYLDVLGGLVEPEELAFHTVRCPYGPHWHDAKDAMVNCLMAETCGREAEQALAGVLRDQ